MMMALGWSKLMQRRISASIAKRSLATRRLVAFKDDLLLKGRL
jgi:hypothetical protein